MPQMGSGIESPMLLARKDAAKPTTARSRRHATAARITRCFFAAGIVTTRAFSGRGLCPLPFAAAVSFLGFAIVRALSGRGLCPLPLAAVVSLLGLAAVRALSGRGLCPLSLALAVFLLVVGFLLESAFAREPSGRRLCPLPLAAAVSLRGAAVAREPSGRRPRPFFPRTDVFSRGAAVVREPSGRRPCPLSFAAVVFLLGPAVVRALSGRGFCPLLLSTASLSCVERPLPRMEDKCSRRSSLRACLLLCSSRTLGLRFCDPGGMRPRSYLLHFWHEYLLTWIVSLKREYDNGMRSIWQNAVFSLWEERCEL